MRWNSNQVSFEIWSLSLKETEFVLLSFLFFFLTVENVDIVRENFSCRSRIHDRDLITYTYMNLSLYRFFFFSFLKVENVDIVREKYSCRSGICDYDLISVTYSYKSLWPSRQYIYIALHAWFNSSELEILE